MKIKCAYSKVVPLAELVPNPRNPNTHPEKQIEMLAHILKFQGWRQPIVVSNQSGFIVKGHGRLMAAESAGFFEAPVDFQDYESDAQEWADLIADNRLAELAELDRSILKDLIEELDTGEIDLDLTGYDEGDLAGLMSEFFVPDDGLTDMDEIPVQVEARTKTGDLWQLGKHRLVCGDSTKLEDCEKVMGGEVATLMVTDPPYGVNYDPKWRDRCGLGAAATGEVYNDDIPDWTAVWENFKGGVAYVWHADLFSSVVRGSLETEAFAVRAQIIWAKTKFAISRGHYHWKHEPCFYAVRKGHTANWVGDRKQTTLWEITHDQIESGHSTQKPVECMERPLVNHGGDVFEPFLGSGTTIIAAERQKRICYAIEIDAHYCDVSIQRWENFTGKKAKKIKK